MRVIVSTIGTPPYGISKYLVDISQPTLNKSKDKVNTQNHLFRKLKPEKLNQMKYKFHTMSQTFIHQYLLIMQLM